MSSSNIYLGLDIGSVSAKLIALLPRTADPSLSEALRNSNLFVYTENLSYYSLFASKAVKILGDPIGSAQRLLECFIETIEPSDKIHLQVTGSQGKQIAELLNVPFINEFKAISRGVAELVPDARTVLEIGGNASRFIKIAFDPTTKELSILDYERNGECAAGTGSFIDQQAARLRFNVEDIGRLVKETDATANIAGRCSVFAKSDMVHAQQRGYSPGAIFKGLCEAVVRNYKGTVLRQKELLPKVVFVGGVAANLGVIEAMNRILDLTSDELIVPSLHCHVGALGCAILAESSRLKAELVKNMKYRYHQKITPLSRSHKLEISLVRFPKEKSLNSKLIQNDRPIKAYLGLDIGSVSTNLVLLDQQGRVIDEIYTTTEGRPVEVVQRELNKWNHKWADQIEIIGVGTTGSGRELIGELVGADAIHDEITAHKTGASFVAETLFNEQVETIFEIGGQDSKFIAIENGVVVDFAMNEACAAGTGSFLEEQATKLGISIKEDFARLALSSTNPVQMGERCTVFMEKDVSSYLQQGIPKEDISAGLALAVVQNYLNRVVAGRKIGNVIYFQGGTAYNKAVAAAFATRLQKTIVVPPHNGVIGAIGAALLAKQKMDELQQPSRFRGFDLSNVNFSIRTITCKGCSNQCDVQECVINGEKTYWGDKCSERFRKKRKINRQAVIPDLFALYQQLLLQEIPSSNGLDIQVGIPRAMYFYDRFPFWQAYFVGIGAKVVLSDSTHRQIVAQGRELCIAEPCFPIIVAHGHVLNLFDKQVDYVFVPNLINAEPNLPGRESWYCPWGQTLPHVLKSALKDPRLVDRILAPIVRFRDGKKSVKKSLAPVAAKLGVSEKISNQATDMAFAVLAKFKENLKQIGRQALQTLAENQQAAVVIIGRPYNIYDTGMNLNVPKKLRENYGINVIPMDFLTFEDIDINDIHENMFWSYGQRILQAAKLIGQNDKLHLIHITNFKCGPDSYLKHFIREACGTPYLTLQFDDHSNDAGIMTRCEAFLESKGLLREQPVKKERLTIRLNT